MRTLYITTPAYHHSVFTGRIPFQPPNQQHQSTEGKNPWKGPWKSLNLLSMSLTSDGHRKSFVL